MINLNRNGDILTVLMDRPLDSAGVKALQDALGGNLVGVRHLVVDAGGMSFVGPESLRYLQALDERMLNVVDGTFRLVNLGDDNQEMMYAQDWSDVLPDQEFRD